MVLISFHIRWCTVGDYLSTAVSKKKKKKSIHCSRTKHMLRHTCTKQVVFVKTTNSLQPVEHKAEIRWISAPCLSLYCPSKMSTIQYWGVAQTNTSPLSVSLAPDPLWCCVVLLKLWKDLCNLSSICSTAVMQPPEMSYTLLLLPRDIDASSAFWSLILTCLWICVCVNMCTRAGK